MANNISELLKEMNLAQHGKGNPGEAIIPQKQRKKILKQVFKKSKS
jgi:hypothetical protein